MVSDYSDMVHLFKHQTHAALESDQSRPIYLLERSEKFVGFNFILLLLLKLNKTHIMSNIKLTYFNGRGLGETIRMLLKIGNVDFEDIRIELGNWSDVKPTTPFGQLPLYEENGKVVWQSSAIARYLARKVKLAGDTEWESLEIDAIVDTLADFLLKHAAYFWESDEERKAKAKETFVNEAIPFYLDKFEKIAAQNNRYLAAKKFSWADIHFLSTITVIETRLGYGIIGDRLTLKALIAKVSEVPAIKEWIASRPPSDF